MPKKPKTANMFIKKGKVLHFTPTPCIFCVQPNGKIAMLSATPSPSASPRPSPPQLSL